MAKKQHDSASESEQPKSKKADPDAWMRSKKKTYVRKTARQMLRAGRIPAGLTEKALRELATRESKRR